MCLNHRQLDPQSRRRIVVANLSLILAILLWNSERWNWVHTSSQFQKNWLDAITGFLFGLYITINLIILRRRGGCGQSQNG
jgi:hypothetical protein